ncbi:MAG: MFS transporter [Chloroflexi bacterium]|nr:MFS transporter [Chloroflexota bacterium]
MTKSVATEGGRRGIFFGWWIVAGGFTIAVYAMGTVMYGFGAFFTPVIVEFGWSRAATSVAMSLRSAEAGFIDPVLGMAIDRLGPRKVMVFGAIVTCLSFLWMSTMDSLFSFYGASMVLAIGFACINGLPPQVAVANWFHRYRSRAMGILIVGNGVSTFLVPGVVLVIALFNWRIAMVLVGLGFLVVGIPAALFMRHHPEPYGYFPDGEKPASGFEGEAADVVGHGHGHGSGAGGGLTAREALRTPAFWLLSVGFGIGLSSLTAVTLHAIPFMESIGLERGTAAFVVSAMGAVSIVGRLGFGWLGDLYSKRYVIVVCFLLQVVGFMVLVLMNEMWMLGIWVLIYAPGYGGSIPLRPAITADYFGRKAYGTISGLMMAASVIFSFASPIFAGWIYDTTGSYRVAFLVFAFLAALGVPFIFLAKPPQRAKAGETAELLSVPAAQADPASEGQN